LPIIRYKFSTTSRKIINRPFKHNRWIPTNQKQGNQNE